MLTHPYSTANLHRSIGEEMRKLYYLPFFMQDQKQMSFEVVLRNTACLLQRLCHITLQETNCILSATCLLGIHILKTIYVLQMKRHITDKCCISMQLALIEVYHQQQFS